MKAKQIVDLGHVEKLRNLISTFEHLYLNHDATPHAH